MIDGPMLPHVVARGPSTITYQGRAVERVVGFVRPEDITCLAGHRIKSGDVIFGEHGLMCTHKANERAAACGAMLWVVMLPAPRHESLFLYADVEYRELVEWQRGRYTLEDILRYLGLWCLRADARRAARARDRRMT